MLECITGGYVLEKLLMQLRAALFAIIIVVVDLIL